MPRYIGPVTPRWAGHGFWGGCPLKDKKEIIFFDELGFGWVVDQKTINLIHDCSPNAESIVEKTLSELLRPA